MEDQRDRATVRATYDRIADHFAQTREYPWPEVESFCDERAVGEGDGTAPDGSTLAVDVGCGNGRHTELLAGYADRVVGVDVSRGLLETARERLRSAGVLDPVALVVGDAARLPLRAGVATTAVYVATLHHLPDRDTRVGSLDELARVLAPGGRGLVSAWSTAHDRFDATDGFDTTVDWTLPGGETVPRYYHVYDPEEFRRDLDASALSTVEAFVSSGNCYAVVTPE